jgi:GT2 family glycosyltransferase
MAAWPDPPPRFTVVLVASAPNAGHLADSLRSVLDQTYPHWRLCCLSARPPSGDEQSILAYHAADKRFVPHWDGTPLSPVAQSDHTLWLWQGDFLEPQALHRLATAVLAHDSDVLYSDEVSTSPDDLNRILAVHLRPAFSYDHLLGDDYLGSLLAVRSALLPPLAATAGRFLSRPGLDQLFRILERARGVTHVADVLYRHRMSPSKLRPAAEPTGDCLAVQRHFSRLEVQAKVHPLAAGLGRSVTFPIRLGSHVAIIIPTRDQGNLLRRCLTSLEATVPAELADVWIVDHQCRDSATLGFFQSLSGRYRVLRYEGPFNFSAINNRAAAEVGRAGGYSHLLLLNDDTEALAPGWLEHMLGHACRPEVGIVGALLIYPSRQVQHAGVTVGLHHAADNRGRFLPAFDEHGQCVRGRDSWLLLTRDQAAVTGACLLIRTEVYRQLGGMDERLAVGFGDADLCLRARTKGYKVLIDGQAVLLHHESATRGKKPVDPHPRDTRRFRRRYRATILGWDPFSHPLSSRSVDGALEWGMACCAKVAMRHQPLAMFRPTAAAA